MNNDKFKRYTARRSKPLIKRALQGLFLTAAGKVVKISMQHPPHADSDILKWQMIQVLTSWSRK